VCGSAHTRVCSCLLISLLALVILMRVGGPSLRVMSVRSISSSLVVDDILFWFLLSYFDYRYVGLTLIFVLF
jgi:hypothetical protein